MAARASVRVRGVTYTQPDAAYVAAAELEDNAETVATNLRRGGKEAEAEQVADRARADAERLRAWAREREAADAGATDQPDDTPTRTPQPRKRASTGRRRSTGGSRSTSRTRSRSSAPRLTPRTRTIIASTGVPQAADTATGIALKLAGWTIGIAFLTLLLTDRGVSAFGTLAGGAANGLRWIVDPIDPLAPRKPSVGDFGPGGGNFGGGEFPSTTPAKRTVTVPPLTAGALA